MKLLYCKSRASTDGESTYPIHINNCGYYRNIPIDRSTSRLNGRRDYLLVFVLKGQFICGSQSATNGQGFLFFPGTPQNYTYKAKAGEDTMYEWIHFTGADIPALLASSHLKEGFFDSSGHQKRIGELFRMMFSAYSEELSCADAYCEGLLRAVLSLAGSVPSSRNPFHKIIRLMADPNDSRTVKEYAALCKMSEAHFIRSFKAATGLPPRAFYIRQRILLAKELLEETDTPIGTIGNMCGFSDPLYFSRVFKKETDTSPREYRNRLNRSENG